MIKVQGKFEALFSVELLVDSFSEICFDKISQEESDDIIKNAIYGKYGIIPSEIICVTERK